MLALSTLFPTGADGKVKSTRSGQLYPNLPTQHARTFGYNSFASPSAVSCSIR
jgi:hypothetical protein